MRRELQEVGGEARPSCNFGEQESLGKKQQKPFGASASARGLGFVAPSRVLLMMRHNDYCQNDFHYSRSCILN